MAFTDLHLHLLPGLDDGPLDLTESLTHAGRLAAHGVTEAVVTPHVGHPDFPVEVAEIAPRTRHLQSALEQAGIPLRLHPGGEIHATAVDQLPRSALEAIAQGPPQARWVLLEAPFSGIDMAFLASIGGLREIGLATVIAHPERSACGHEHLLEAVREGALLQVNVCSLLGVHGAQVRERAVRMATDGSAYVLASDGHGARRKHTLRLGRDLALGSGVHPDRAAQLTGANPRFLLRHGIPLIGGLRTPSRSA